MDVPIRNIANDPDFTVIAEADDYIVVNKPAPLLVHPSVPGNPPTLLDGVAEGLHDVVLPEHIGKALGSVFTCKNLVTHSLLAFPGIEPPSPGSSITRSAPECREDPPFVSVEFRDSCGGVLGA